MLGASLRHDGDELLVLPAGLAGYRAGHQAGLPLLAPWANRVGARPLSRSPGESVDLEGLDLGTDDNGLPIHGTMTAQAGWEIVRLEPGALSVRFDYGARPDLLAAFPFPHELVDRRLGRRRIPLGHDDRAADRATTPCPLRSAGIRISACRELLAVRGGCVLPDCDHLELDDRESADRTVNSAARRGTSHRRPHVRRSLRAR